MHKKEVSGRLFPETSKFKYIQFLRLYYLTSLVSLTTEQSLSGASSGNPLSSNPPSLCSNCNSQPFSINSALQILSLNAGMNVRSSG